MQRVNSVITHHSATLLQTLGRLLLLSALVLVSGCGLLKDLPVGQGFAAKHLCSMVFVAGLDPDWVKKEIIAPKVKPLPWIWRVTVDRDHKTTQVSTWLPGLSYQARAVFRPGLGCTLLTDRPPEEVLERPFSPLPAAVLDPEVPWPHGSGGVDQSQLAPVTRAGLAEMARDFFAIDQSLELKTTAFLIIKDGRLVYEHYAHGANETTPLMGWSLTKTLSATLAGLLWDQQRLALDEPVTVPAWQQRSDLQISARHLLHMSSGLYSDESYGGLTEITQMLYQEPNQFAYALSQPVIRPAGTLFQYSTAETARLTALIQHLVGGTEQAMYNFYQQQLFRPLGITSGLVEFDATGHMVGGAYGHLTARDWARLGLLYLQRGQWQGQTLISEDWIDFALTPASTNQEYGAQLWLNTAGMRWASVDSDAFLFTGYDGQRVIMLPSAQLILVRLGMAGKKETLQPVMEQLLNQLVAVTSD